ncbi:hypothetical protein BaRGS_00018123 [Batillaria attramentaria]|uniref:Uncharacterized protein n=1 Tax=Batillaria attramentaria TaxID=370345 RepID=A0ABD0KTX6_9CAEN
MPDKELVMFTPKAPPADAITGLRLEQCDTSHLAASGRNVQQLSFNRPMKTLDPSESPTQCEIRREGRRQSTNENFAILSSAQCEIGREMCIYSPGFQSYPSHSLLLYSSLLGNSLFSFFSSHGQSCNL